MTSQPSNPEPPGSENVRRRHPFVRILIVILLLLLLLFLLLRGCDRPPENDGKNQSASPAASAGPLAKTEKRKSSQSKADDDQPEGEAGPVGLTLDGKQGAKLDGEAVAEALARLRGVEEEMRRSGAALPVGPGGPSPLATLLPEKLMGHPRVDVASHRTVFQEKQGLLGSARASYGEKTAPHIILSLGDTGLAAAARRSQEFLSGSELIESATEVRRSGQRDGKSFQLAWRAQPAKASVSILVADRLNADVLIEGAASVREAEKAFDELPLGELEALAASSPRKQGSQADFGVSDIESVLGRTLLNQTPSGNTDGNGPGAVPEALIAALPAKVGDLPQVSRRGNSKRPGSARPSPSASAEYAAAEGGIRYKLTLEAAPPNLSMLGLPQRTWDRMAALQQPNQQLLVEKDRRMMIVRQDKRAAAEARVLLSPDAMLTLTADGFNDSAAAGVAALSVIRGLDLDALDAATRAAAGDTKNTDPIPPQANPTSE